ncbi:MAG: polyphosphate kinase 1 [Chloroflexi bacterium]|nr:polyphosphate kinase 1 [Chloroflexota bacterium]
MTLGVSRELSLLAFNARVLSEASNSKRPLLDRFRFLGIVASNVDEFYGVRVAGIQDQQAAGLRTPGPDGRTPEVQLALIREATSLLTESAQESWGELIEELRGVGLPLRNWDDLDAAEQSVLTERFTHEIFPVLTPLAVDAGHPFPLISSLSLSIAIRLRTIETQASTFARVKVPNILGRIVQFGDGDWILLEDLIKAHLDQLFPGSEIVEAHPFRVTRDADLDTVEEEADDLLEAIEEGLRQRRFGSVVRLEVRADMPEDLLNLLVAGLEIGRSEVQVVKGLIDLTVALQVASLPRPELRAPRWQSVTPARIAASASTESPGGDMFTVISEGDLLVHHPYDSFEASVDQFFAQAADDPDVLSIRSTLYRTGATSSIPAHLIRAAHAGKEVVVLVELKARFDEAANIEWARRLEEAGAHVVYGVMGLKTHCKATLIARREGSAVRRYVHLSTGNYNPKTARGYTDLGLFTTNEVMATDVGVLFNFLTGAARASSYKRILVAPDHLRSEIKRRIERLAEQARTGATTAITIKVNALIDPEMIHLLDQAAEAGVSIDLIVRGMCGLLPDPARHATRLRIRSIIGDYLEHSRIYRFAGPEGVELFAGSADLMERNLDRRVEVLFPLDEGEVRRKVDEILAALLADTSNAWELQPDGAWERLADTGNSSFETLRQVALAASQA